MSPAIHFTTQPRDCYCGDPYAQRAFDRRNTMRSRATTGQGLRIGHSGDCPARCDSMVDYEDEYSGVIELRCDIEWNHKGDHTSRWRGRPVRWP